MGLFDFFKASKSECAMDEGVNDIMNFIETVLSFASTDCPMLSVGFGSETMGGRFFDSNNSFKLSLYSKIPNPFITCGIL